jgi:acetyl-CoA carboxylase biotin carboxyl carrier protein
MDFKQVQELIRLINKSNIGEISVEEKGFKIVIKQKQDIINQVMAAPAPVYAAAQPVQAANPAQSLPASAASGGGDKTKTSATEPIASNLITIKSPMIGTFYRRSSPDKPLLAEVGDELVPGKVLCIIEAMKLFNEIECEVKGRVVKILVADASPVEYDQPLFLVDPT